MKTVTIRASEGLYEIRTPTGSHVSSTLEHALEHAAPSAPPEKLHACSEILEGLLGPLSHIQVHEGLSDTQT